MREISDVLDDHGVFAFRLNAFGDKHSGCPESIDGWKPIVVDGIAKQFFTENKIREAISGLFEVVSIESFVVERYGNEKLLIECIAHKNSPS